MRDRKSCVTITYRGAEYIHTQRTSTLETHRVKIIDPTGKEFNESEHESVESVEIEDPKQDGMVVEVVLKGYAIGEKIIRAAKVKVGKK